MTSPLEARAEANRAWHALTVASSAWAAAPDEPHAQAAAEIELRAAARRYGLACELVSVLSRSERPRRRRGDK